MITYEIRPVGEIDGAYISSFDTLEEAERAAADLAYRNRVDVKVFQLISVTRVMVQMERG